MSNIQLFTTPFRVNFPHLDAPYAKEGTTEVPKYSVGAMFPKNGMVPENIANGVASSNAEILAALDDVCMEAFGIMYQKGSLVFNEGYDATSFPAPDWNDDLIVSEGYAVLGEAGIENNAALVGVNFPPPLVDGDLDFKSEKNAQGIAIKTNVPFESSVGMWKMGFKNIEAVGCFNPEGDREVDPKSIYSGCWAVAEIEITAYVGKKGNVIAIKLLGIQMAYDDERLGGGETVAKGFGGRAITGAVKPVAKGFGINKGSAVPTPKPIANGTVAPKPIAPAGQGTVAPKPQAPAPKSAPKPAPKPAPKAAPKPKAPAPIKPAEPVETLVFAEGYGRESFPADVWTDEMIIAENYATLADPATDYLQP